MGFAQYSKSSLKGSITDEDQNIVPFANIAAYSSTDSTLIKGVASDLDGNFSFTQKWKQVHIQISYF